MITASDEFLSIVARDAHTRSVREAESALDDIAALVRRLAQLSASISTGIQPEATVTGDTGIVHAAMDIQRHVDSWITHAQAEAILTGGQ
jgi:hypothetical protein